MFEKNWPLIDPSGRIFVNDGEVAKILNEYFVTVLTNNVTKNDNIFPRNIDIPSVSTQNLEMNDETVVRTINEFKENKSPRLDGIT